MARRFTRTELVDVILSPLHERSGVIVNNIMEKVQEALYKYSDYPLIKEYFHLYGRVCEDVEESVTILMQSGVISPMGIGDSGQLRYALPKITPRGAMNETRKRMNLSLEEYRFIRKIGRGIKVDGRYEEFS